MRVDRREGKRGRGWKRRRGAAGRGRGKTNKGATKVVLKITGGARVKEQKHETNKNKMV